MEVLSFFGRVVEWAIAGGWNTLAISSIIIWLWFFNLPAHTWGAFALALVFTGLIAVLTWLDLVSGRGNPFSLVIPPAVLATLCFFILLKRHPILVGVGSLTVGVLQFAANPNAGPVLQSLFGAG